MTHLPDADRFADLAGTGGLVPVYRRLFADGLTPLSAFARIDAGDGGCLFESVVGGEKVGRYSFLGADPFMRFEARGTQVRVTRGGTVETFACPDPLAELERRMAEFRPVRLPELPPFTSGAVGFAAYDSVRYAERLPEPPPDDLGLPDMSFALYDRLVVFDNVTKSLVVVALARIDDASPAGIARARAEACRRIDATIELLSRPHDWPPPSDIGPRPDVGRWGPVMRSREQLDRGVDPATGLRTRAGDSGRRGVVDPGQGDHDERLGDVVEHHEPVVQREAHVGQPEVVRRRLRQTLGVADGVVGGEPHRPAREGWQFRQADRTELRHPALQLGEGIGACERLHRAATCDPHLRAARLEPHERIGAEEAVAADFLAADDALEQAAAIARIDPREGGEGRESVGEQPPIHRHEPARARQVGKPVGVGKVRHRGRAWEGGVHGGRPGDFSQETSHRPAGQQ